MKLLATGIVVGVIGTIVMDILNYLSARSGVLTKIETGTIGRMAAGWFRGRFFYNHPSEMTPVANERFYGYVAHYFIGIGLSVPFVLLWGLLVGGQISPAWALMYGISTTVASWFFVYPSMGFGVFGIRSPDGTKACFSSLANHLFYGIGLALGVAIL